MYKCHEIMQKKEKKKEKKKKQTNKQTKNEQNKQHSLHWCTDYNLSQRLATEEDTILVSHARTYIHTYTYTYIHTYINTCHVIFEYT